MPYDPNPEETSLAIPAEYPTMNELMSRRPEFPRRAVAMLVRILRDKRTTWGDARDARRDKREEVDG